MTGADRGATESTSSGHRNRRRLLYALATAPVLSSGCLLFTDRRPTPTATRTPSGAVAFGDDFDYATERLADNGWTVVNSEFETSDSRLLADAGYDEVANVAHAQQRASGTFRMEGVRNAASFFGLRMAFITDTKRIKYGNRPSEWRGYMVNFRQARHGDAVLVRSDGNGESTKLLTLESDHGGEPRSVRIQRDPESYEFTCFYDGEAVGTVTDDTYTKSAYWAIGFGGPHGTQSIDEVAVDSPVD